MVFLEEVSPRPVDVHARGLHIRLAETQAEIEEAQRLRYRVFCEEMSAKPDEAMRSQRREYDLFDPFCDHLLIFDTTRGEPPGTVIATYRFLRREQAKRAGRFYSEMEYGIEKLLEYPGEIMELGRSCVDPAYRSGASMQLLWRGIAEYVFFYEVRLLFGCASLHGTDPAALALPLSYLHYHHRAPDELCPRALPDRYLGMALLPPQEVDDKAALLSLPPLIKGYLRLGGFVGDGAVIDSEFGTTDVAIVVKTDRVTDKYYRHFARER